MFCSQNPRSRRRRIRQRTSHYSTEPPVVLQGILDFTTIKEYETVATKLKIRNQTNNILLSSIIVQQVSLPAESISP